NDLVVGALLAAGAAAMVAARRIVLDRTALWALAFAAVGALSAVLAVPRFGLTSFELLVSLAYLARWVFYFGVYVVAVNVVRDQDVVGVWRALETTTLCFAAFGVLQSAFLPDFAQIVYPSSREYLDWDPQGHRLVSTFLDPNFAGAFIAIALLVQVAGLAVGARVAAWKPLLLALALVLTVSRSSVLAFVAGAVAIVLARGVSARVLRLAAVLGVLVAAAFPKLLELARAYNKLQIDPSALARVISWVRGVQVVHDHPVIGIGFNTWAFVQERAYGWERAHAATYGIDGGLLFIAALTGAVGLALYVAMLVSVGRRARRVWRERSRPPEPRMLAVGAVASIVAIVVHSCFSNSIMLPFLVEPLWVLWALVAVIARTPAPARDAV
ncbi:MAG: O-antigen ligase family protein, partial [Gemmatimonadaceae bacterium]